MYTSCWRKIANEMQRETKWERVRERTINMSQRGRDNARERKWWWWWQELAKKWQNVGTGFSFHFISCHSIPFHGILFRFVPLCSHLCQFVWWRGHVVSSMNMFVVSHSPALSVFISLSVIIIKMPWPGGRLCKIFWCLKVTERQEKKNLNWTDI